MREHYIKKYWDEENILFYIHFQGEQAVRQIEISPEGKKLLSLSNLTESPSLYDQNFSDLDLEDKDFITKQEFEEAWKS